jgi:hypothetical protein
MAEGDGVAVETARRTADDSAGTVADTGTDTPARPAESEAAADRGDQPRTPAQGVPEGGQQEPADADSSGTAPLPPAAVPAALAPPPRRKTKRVRDMVISLIVVGLPIAFVVLVADPHKAGDPVHPIDYRVDAAGIAREAPFPLAAPTALPAGWAATSDDLSGTPLDYHLGIVTQQRHYADLEQSAGSVGALLGAALDAGATPAGAPVVIDGVRWQPYQGTYPALVRADPKDHVVLAGGASMTELTQLAALVPAD